MQKSHANELHVNLSHPIKSMMRETTKKLLYRVKGKLEVCEDFPTDKIKQKILYEVAKDRDLNIGKMTYLDLDHKINQVMEVPTIG